MGENKHFGSEGVVGISDQGLSDIGVQEFIFADIRK